MLFPTGLQRSSSRNRKGICLQVLDQNCLGLLVSPDSSLRNSGRQAERLGKRANVNILRNFCVSQERPGYCLETKPSKISGVQNKISVLAHVQHRCASASGNPGEPGLEEGTAILKAVSPFVRALNHWAGWSHAHPTRGVPRRYSEQHWPPQLTSRIISPQPWQHFSFFPP